MDNLNNTTTFKRFSHIFPVRGKTKSALYNIHKGNIKFIPNSLMDVMTLLDAHPIEKVKEEVGKDNAAVFQEYMDFLQDQYIGFTTDEPQFFPEMPIQYAVPDIINNAVIEYENDGYDIVQVLQQLEMLLCRHLELRIITENMTYLQMNKILTALNDKVFRSATIVFRYSPLISNEEIEALFSACQKIDVFFIYNAPKTVVSEELRQNIFYVERDFEEEEFHTHFPKNKYIVNIPYFMEARQFNPYYNKKVCIDRLGNIKNCLMHERNFGNVNEAKLEEVVQSEDFQVLWHASHDKIVGIRDSELRYCIMVTENLEQLPDGSFQIIQN